MAFEEARESMSDIIRWTENPKNAEDKSAYLGPVLTGYFIGVKTEVGKNNSNLYEILMSDEGPNKGRKVAIWGSDLLDERFALVPKNCMVRVTCLGIQQPKSAAGRAYMGFKVEFDKTAVRPAEFTEAAPTAPAASSVQTPGQLGGGYTGPLGETPAAPAAAPVAPAPTVPGF